MTCLPANYPNQMYAAVVAGQQCWQAGVRPPTQNAMRVAHHAAASLLRAMRHTTPTAQFSQPLESGWVGVDPAMVVVIHQFLQGYNRQLQHACVMVRCNTQHGLYEAPQRMGGRARRM